MEKKYDRLSAELLCRQQWATENTYTCDLTNKSLYTIDTPPPTVSGTLHIGHLFSYTQTDIIARHKRMQGRAVFYPFGFDDNGLPTERYVEKKCAVRAHTMKRSEFIALCLQESQLAAQTFKDLWQKVGISANWQHTYSTISAQARLISQRSFLQLLEKNVVYRRYEPALYCTACRTSVAQAELDDATLPSVFYTLDFGMVGGTVLHIGTTRPELLGSCVALLYHPTDDRYAHLYKKFATTPLFGTQVPILHDDKVDPQKGTGLVMVCTFGDTTDIEWYKKYNFPYIQTVGIDGKMTAQAGILAGLSVAAARAKVVEELQKVGCVKAEKPLVHTVSVHERCKAPVEYMLLAQWFVRLLEHKKQFIEIAHTIDWQPHFMKARYVDWVENLQWDWCISRQRMYGIPFPVWHCQDCQTVIPATYDQLPIDPQELPAPVICTKCNSSNVVPDTDVMDTWNTSSLTPYLVQDLYNQQHAPLTAAQFIPMSLRPQAHDIIRTWAFDTIVKTFFHEEKAPWQTIVISGHVLSDKSEKISKSKGNETKTPDALLTEFSADAIRYWTASASLGHDVAFSVDQIKLGNRLVTKLWNAFLFAYPHLQGVDVTRTPSDLGAVNEWLLHELTIVEQRYHAALDAYEFSGALQAVEQFFWGDYCDNYIELVKHSLFNPDLYEKSQVQATQWTLYKVGLRLLQLYAPYVPFVTETIYQQMYAEYEHAKSIHQTEFGQYQHPFVFQESKQAVTLLIELVSSVRKLKTGLHLSLKTPVETLTIFCADSAYVSFIESHTILLKGVTQAVKVNVTDASIHGVDTIHKDEQDAVYVTLYTQKG